VKRLPPDPEPAIPFHLGNCTIIEAQPPEDEAAHAILLGECDTVNEFWGAASQVHWMLRLLRAQAPYLPIDLERPLRLFVLECVKDVSGRDVPALARILTAVRGRLDKTTTPFDLERARADAHAYVTPGGVQGLHRYSPQAAGALAVWHTGNPDPSEASYWTAAFTALHEAFVVVRRRADLWKPRDPSRVRVDAREAAFVRDHPDVYAEALADSRRRLADLLRSMLPSPFGRPLPGDVFTRENADGTVAVFCVPCGLTTPGAEPFELPDMRLFGCTGCGHPLIHVAH
jgi:hypothetical protein